MIRLDVVRQKANCNPWCSLSISDDGKCSHNGANWHYDLAKYEDPEYPGPGWLSVAMETIAKQHETAVPGKRRK